MKQLSFEVNGQYIKRSDNFVPVAKSRNYFYAHFDFKTPEWTGTKTALFQLGNDRRAAVLDDNGDCLVPWEFFDTDCSRRDRRRNGYLCGGLEDGCICRRGCWSSECPYISSGHSRSKRRVAKGAENNRHFVVPTNSRQKGKTDMGSKEFLTEAKAKVAEYFNSHKDKTDVAGKLYENDVFVVWYCKTLQNHKALLSTPVSDGMYYEITYNGDRNEMYFDAYKKWENIKFDM